MESLCHSLKWNGLCWQKGIQSINNIYCIYSTVYSVISGTSLSKKYLNWKFESNENKQTNNISKAVNIMHYHGIKARIFIRCSPTAWANTILHSSFSNIRIYHKAIKLIHSFILNSDLHHQNSMSSKILLKTRYHWLTSTDSSEASSNKTLSLCASILTHCFTECTDTITLLSASWILKRKILSVELI